MDDAVGCNLEADIPQPEANGLLTGFYIGLSSLTSLLFSSCLKACSYYPWTQNQRLCHDPISTDCRQYGVPHSQVTLVSFIHRLN